MRKRRTSGGGTAPTIEDVARAAGVSVATVSRTLNSPDVVRQKTKERVAAAVAATGYTPNFAGRALAGGRTLTVGAVIPTLNNAIFAHGVNAFEEALRRRGYTLLLSVSNYDEQTELTNVRRMIERGVDALMLVGTDHAPETIDRLRRAGTPFVCTWSHAPGAGLPTVGFDNRGAMAEVVRHLVGLGHTRIAMIAGITKGNDRARERLAGVRETLAALSVPFPAHRLAEVRYSVDEASICASRLLGMPDRPSAIICGNDVIAYGTLFAANALGIGVPDDLSVVGFDDIALSARVPPGLTTVRVPAVRMGEVAANRLADMVENGAEIGVDAAVSLPTELIIRATTAPPAQR